MEVYHVIKQFYNFIEVISILVRAYLLLKKYCVLILILALPNPLQSNRCRSLSFIFVDTSVKKMNGGC